MRIVIDIDVENDAFINNEDEEVSRIIKVVATHIEHGYHNGKLMDINGNTCGKYRVT